MRIEDLRVTTNPLGDSRPITESELLTLVADLATETVQWCELHGRLMFDGHRRGPNYACVRVERFLLPVGVLVDGGGHDAVVS